MEQTLTPLVELIDQAPDGAPTLKQALRSDGISRAEHSALVAERLEQRAKGGRPPAVKPVRDILVQKGYDAMAKLGPKVAARLEEALDNKSDPIHERAVDILAKRTLPIAFFEGLAKQEFREDDDGARAPHITINISTAAVEPAIVVEVPFKELP